MSKRKTASSKVGFLHKEKIPKPAACLKSVGKFVNDEVPVEYQPNGQFDPLREPTHEDDWLAQYEPDNQTYDSWYSRFVTYRDTTVPKKTIYLLPIGKKDCVKELPSLSLLAEFCTAFFLGLKVQIMDPYFIEILGDDAHVIKLNVPGKRPKTYRLLARHSHEYDAEKMNDDHVQYSVHPLMNLCGAVFPDDGRCIVGLTMEDLYSDTTDSFTVGMASGPLSGVAVFSFCRYDPLFNAKHTNLAAPKKRGKKAAKPTTEDHATILLERSCKVLSHEIGHMMGIAHCTYYECLMNGSGHLEEDFRQPLYLCPTDLRKIITSVGANALERYHALVAFYEKVGFHDVLKWMKARVQFIEAASVNTTEKPKPPSKPKEIIILED